MEPDLSQTAAKHQMSVELIRLDISTKPDAAQALGVRGTPTLIGLADGEEIFRHTGRLRLPELENLFSSLSGGDAPRARSRTDLVIRVSAGAALTTIGLVTGPSWPLVIIGFGVLGFGFAPLLKWG
jgi:hypothetical protein